MSDSSSATTTVKMHENGRIIVPQEVRQALGVDGQKALVEVEVSLLRPVGDE